MLERLREFAQIATHEFSDIRRLTPEILETRLRLYLKRMFTPNE